MTGSSDKNAAVEAGVCLIAGGEVQGVRKQKPNALLVARAPG